MPPSEPENLDHPDWQQPENEKKECNARVYTGLKNKFEAINKPKYYAIFGAVFAILGAIIIHFSLANPVPTADEIFASCTATSCNGVPVGNPYIDASQDSVKPPQYDYYKQPWRSYMQAVPAAQMLNGIGINYNPHNETPAQDDANLKYLASIGVHAIRLEMPWGSIDPSNENQFTAAEQAKFNGILTACKKYGISPTILLNSNDGAPQPLYPVHTANVVGTAPAKSSQITVTGVKASDIVVHTPNTGTGSSGLSLVSAGEEAANLVTKVTSNADGSLTLDLSEPISQDTSGKVSIYYFKYMPLYPVGTPEFNNTMNGWMQYVKTASNTVKAAGITNYSMEIWNEITFATTFLDIDNYHGLDYLYDKSLPPIIPDIYKPGGRAWQLANQTASYLKNTYGNNVKVIWGFSNTAPTLDQSKDLPTGIDGKSYHPYWTQPNTAQALLTDTKSKPENLVGGSYVPDVTIAMPEGPLMTLPITALNLIGGNLAPDALDPRPTPSFQYYFTENGQQPKDLSKYGFDDTANQTLKAKAILRNYSFWLNKGVDQLDWYCAFDYTPADRGFALLGKGSDNTNTSPVTIQSRSLQNYTNQFSGATPITKSRTPSVGVKDITPDDNTQKYVVFGPSSSGTEPALHYREMFQFLPFQVSDKKFVISTYVMGWNITNSPPPMYFNLDIKDIQGNNATVSYYDPITNTSAPLSVVSRSGNDISVNIESLDYPRLLTIQEN